MKAKLQKPLPPWGLQAYTVLKAAAIHIVHKHNGVIPNSLEELMDVPGLGAYSARAIMAFAFDAVDVPADVNILRFIARLTGLPMVHQTKGSKQLRELLPLLSMHECSPPIEYLLDFTRLICKSGTPKCGLCPLRSRCIYYKSTVQEIADD
jgi:A/G-specific adenine glycosylase